MSTKEVLGRGKRGVHFSSVDDKDAKVCYMKAIILSRLGAEDEAMKYYRLSLAYDPYLEYRANLDPELSGLVNKSINN